MRDAMRLIKKRVRLGARSRPSSVCSVFSGVRLFRESRRMTRLSPSRADSFADRSRRASLAAVIVKNTKALLNTLLRDGAVKNGNCPSAGRRAHPSAGHLFHERSLRDSNYPRGKLRSFVTDVLAVVTSSLKLRDS